MISNLLLRPRDSVLVGQSMQNGSVLCIWLIHGNIDAAWVKQILAWSGWANVFHNITRHLMFRCPSEGQSFAMFDHLVIHVWLKENCADVRRSAILSIQLSAVSSPKITRPAHVEESFSFAPCRSRIGRSTGNLLDRSILVALYSPTTHSCGQKDDLEHREFGYGQN